MKVSLLNFTPLNVAVTATRTCWHSFNRSDNCGEKDKALLMRVANEFKHKSVLEHLVYNFQICEISRACLQELARHRTASLSVKSTRYTLKELKNCAEFTPESRENAEKFLVFTGLKAVDDASILALENLRKIVNSGVSLDLAKYALPECYKTELIWTIDARNLQNFLNLRLSKMALWEIRELACEVRDALPPDHRFLFKEFYGERD